MNVSLIQEQAARSAAIAMGLKKVVIEMDVVVVNARRPRYFFYFECLSEVNHFRHF